MRAIGSGVTLVCGVLIIVGVFLPWISESTSILGLTISVSKSGWSIIDASSWDISAFVLSDNMHALLVLIAKTRVGLRPGRIEPRAVKRRPKPFPLLTQARATARAEVREQGHPKKQR